MRLGDFEGIKWGTFFMNPAFAELSDPIVTFCDLTFSIGHPFLGDYVRLRQNPQWKKICTETNDQYVVFADIINKITRSGGKVCYTLFLYLSRNYNCTNVYCGH